MPRKVRQGESQGSSSRGAGQVQGLSPPPALPPGVTETPTVQEKRRRDNATERSPQVASRAFTHFRIVLWRHHDRRHRRASELRSQTGPRPLRLKFKPSYPSTATLPPTLVVQALFEVVNSPHVCPIQGQHLSLGNLLADSKTKENTGMVTVVSLHPKETKLNRRGKVKWVFGHKWRPLRSPAP